MTGQQRSSGKNSKRQSGQGNESRARIVLAAAVAAGLGVASISSVASAQHIATDHFVIGTTPANGEYTATQLSGSTPQNPTIAGFTGAWANNVGAAGVAQWSANAAGLNTTVPTYEAGDKARFAGVDNLVRRVHRTLDAYTPSNTYYMAFHTQLATTDTNLDGFLGIGFTNAYLDSHLTGANDGLRGLLIGVAGDGTQANMVVRHRDLKPDTTIGTKDDILVSNIPSASSRYTIVKLEVNADPGNPNGDDRISIWLNPTNTLSELSSGEPVVFNSFCMTANDNITQLSLAASDYSAAGSVDEPRFASTWGGASGFAETQWAQAGGGSWGDSSNWSSGVPTGLAANFLSSITGDSTVTAVLPQTTGVMNFDNSFKYTITGSPITLDVASGLTQLTVVSGSHEINAPLNLADSITLNVIPSASKLTLTNLGDASALSVVKIGAGMAEVNNVRANKLIISAGTLKILPNGTSTGTTTVGSGGLLGSNAGGPLLGKLDLTNNKLVVTAGTLGAFDGGTQTYGGITGEIQKGRNGGAWNGIGIITSETDAAAASGLTTLAVAKAEDVGYAGGTFGGISVATGDVLVMYTYAGDADLSGAIDGDDYVAIDGGFSISATGYDKGDFNYDGRIDADDYFIIDRNYGRQGSPFATSMVASGVSAVPEPASLALLGLSVALLRRRRAAR